MTEQRWYAGVDWASESHHVFLTVGEGRKIGENIFKHCGEGLAEMGVAPRNVENERQALLALSR